MLERIRKADTAFAAILRRPAHAHAKGHRQQEQALAHQPCGFHEGGEDHFGQSTAQKLRPPTIARGKARVQQNLDIAGKLRAVVAAPASKKQREQGANRRGIAAACQPINSSQQQDRDIKGRAQEKQNRLDQLPARHGCQARQPQQRQILHIPRRPTQIARDEITIAWRIAFAAAGIIGQHAHLPASGMQPRCLYLIMRQDMRPIR